MLELRLMARIGDGFHMDSEVWDWIPSGWRDLVLVLTLMARFGDRAHVDGDVW